MDSTLAADIILGTYDHDRFKPFWLGGPQHALLGYVHARAVRGQSEACCMAILLHAANSMRREDKKFPYANLMAWHGRTWPAAVRRLPKALVAANWIDRIASSSYSMFGEDEDSKGLHTYLDQWRPSAQNPFSRLPQYDRSVVCGRTFRDVGNGGEYAANLFRPALLSPGEKAQWQGLVRALLAELRGDDARAGGPDAVALYEQLASAMRAMTPDQAERLAAAYSVFGERTYPHPNDTSLKLHTKLAANLYHLLLTNMPDASPLAGLGLETMTSAETGPWYDADNAQVQTQCLRALLGMMGGSVVTIRLAGIEDRFRSAVRLDDLQGAKLLADRVRHAFKRRMCRSLGFDTASASTAADGLTLPDLLCLSESRFSLTYLLPQAYVRGDRPLLKRLYELYDASLYDTVTDPASVPPGGRSDLPLLGHLTADIARVLDDAGETLVLKPTAEGILEGLRAMTPAFGIGDVQADAERAGREEDFGKALVAAYAASQRAVESGGMSDDIWRVVQLMDEAAEDDEPICSSTGAAPAWTELSDHAYGRKEPKVEGLQQYFHAFRAEGEELSQACVAMRALAQGLTQVEALDELITGAFEAETGAVKLKYGGQSSGKAPVPPLLQPRPRIRRSDGLVDLNVAYVRVRSEIGAQPDGVEVETLSDDAADRRVDPLIRFPSVTYAADANGNVAMLTLRPTAALYEDHVLDDAFVRIVGDQDESYAGLLASADLRRLYFNPGPTREPVDPAAMRLLRAELSRVPAHLARVLQRQQTISAFFALLPQRLEAAGVRVLTLEHEHPVGRYLLPAEALATALDVLDRAICLDLLGVNGADLGLDDAEAMSDPKGCNVLGSGRVEGQRRARLRRLLAAYVQDILSGSAIIFKHKQALYLMLRAEERLQGRIERKPVLSMALSDMRGTLVDRSPLHAQYAFADWDRVQAVTDSVDRRSISGLAYDWDQYDQFATAPTEEPVEHEKQRAAMEQLVRARWTNRICGADVRKGATADWFALADAAERPVVDAAFLLMRAARG